MSRITPLYELQQIDSALVSRVARMREIDEQMHDSPRLLAARAEAAEAAELLGGEQARLKQASYTVDDAAGRIRTQDSRLYSGNIKNPKELRQVQEDLVHLKERQRDQEERVIELMLLVEELEESFRLKQEAMDAVEKEEEQYRMGLMEEKDKLVSQAKVLQVKRQRSIDEVPWADLQAYERLRKTKSGLAVAEVRDGLCGGCHVGVPASVLRPARVGSDLVLCPSCGRILYPLGAIEFRAFDHDLDNVDK